MRRTGRSIDQKRRDAIAIMVVFAAQRKRVIILNNCLMETTMIDGRPQ